MKSLALLPLLPLLLLVSRSSEPSSRAASEPAPAAAPVRHCQVPCGIYGDRMRLDMMLEDVATIEKAMGQITTEGVVENQVVRWILTKDEHASKIQDLVASYWLAQRIKAPEDANDAAARAKYMGELELMHQLTVAAMKCKQTTDTAHCQKIRDLVALFDSMYFEPADREHLETHDHH